MTTLEIENEANSDGLATGDINLKLTLRQKTIYDFIVDCEYPSWLRGFDSATLSAGNRYTDLDTSCRRVRHIAVSPDIQVGLKYIGEEEGRVLAAELTTTTGKPEHYYLGFSGSDNFNRVWFDKIADATYTIPYSYDKLIPFPDNTSTLNLNPYIPTYAQWGLVLGLRREIARRRHGKDDAMYAAVSQEYMDFIDRVVRTKEQTKQTKVAYVR